MSQSLEKLIERLERIADRLESAQPTGTVVAADDAINPFVEFQKENLAPISGIAAPLPEKIRKMTDLFIEAHKTAGKIVDMSLKCKKPPQADLQQLLQPILSSVSEIEKLGGYKRDPEFNHGQLLKEAARTASWVLADRTPVDFIDNTFQVGEYYGLQVVREFKGKNESQVQWFQAIKNYCTHLQDFVKEHYRTGLTWNAHGDSIESYMGLPSASPSPPPAPAKPAAPVASKPGVSTAALFGELNQGTGITARLRKVNDSEKTKNRPPEERKFTVPSEVGVKKPAAKPAAKAAAKPPPAPVWRAMGNKLNIENYVDNQEMKFTSGGIQQTIYVYNCKNCALVVTGKVNQVVLDKCTKCKVIVDDVISSFEIINSKDIDVQIMHVCASVLSESSESIRVYVSEEGMPKIEVFSAKSSNVCIYAPGKRIDPDTKEEIEGMIEHALPGTLRSVFENGELSHSFVKHG